MVDSTLFLLLAILFFIICIFLFLLLRLPRSIVSIAPFWKKFSKNLRKSEIQEFIHQLSWCSHWLASRKVGALIVIEGKKRLDHFAMLGYPLKAKTTSELLISIFSNKESALHDGGIIIRDFDVISVSTYFPVAQISNNLSHGARHRASIGITMQTDAVALIVSESKGSISIASKGKIQELETKDPTILSEQLFSALKTIYNT